MQTATMPVQSFLEGYSRIRSKEGMLLGVSKFLSWRFKAATTTGPKNHRRIDMARVEELAVDYLGGKYDYAGDLARYAAYLAGNYAPLSQKTYISPVRQFFLMNGIELRDSQKAAIRKKLPRGYHPRSTEEPFTLEWVRKVCDNAPLRLRALVLVLLSSGMRLSEALHIVPADIDFKASPVTVRLRDSYTRTRAKRDVFISGEAVAALREWMGEREDYLGSKDRYLKNLKRKAAPEDPRIFPFTREAVERLFNTALLKAGYCQEEEDEKGKKTPIKNEKGGRIPIKDIETGRSPIHIHGLRKTFRRELAKAESPRAVDIAEHLMGHAGYLGGTYHKPEGEEAPKFYLENEHRIMIRPGTTPKDREEIKTLRERITQLESMAEEEKTALSLLRGTPEFKAFLASLKK